jgi:hypothetical protein
MYDELVKRLREAAEYVPCIMDREDAIKAADAIEKLSKRVGESIPKDDAEILIAEVAKPRWIPVEERLPEKHKWCLVIGENLYEMDFINSRGVWNTHDKPYAPIDYWMPLPEPPKEET